MSSFEKRYFLSSDLIFWLSACLFKALFSPFVTKFWSNNFEQADFLLFISAFAELRPRAISSLSHRRWRQTISWTRWAKSSLRSGRWLFQFIWRRTVTKAMYDQSTTLKDFLFYYPPVLRLVPPLGCIPYSHDRHAGHSVFTGYLRHANTLT